MTKRILIIGHVWPEPKSSAAGSRMMQLISHFQAQKHELTFASACAKTDHAFDLSTLGISQITIVLNDPSFDRFIQKLNPELVLFDRFMTEEQFGWRVAEQCPKALRILDTEDLHCLRKGRHQAFKEGKSFDDHYLFNEVAKREIASILRSDLSLIISEAEMTILKENFKISDDLLLYLPFMVKDLSIQKTQKFPEYQDRIHFMTIGNFLHEPNYNAVLYLKETIWPRIKNKLPEAELHIYGAYTSQKINCLQNKKEGFLIKGFAENVSEVMQNARICLAPLRFGAGLKGKLLDAMTNGTPCVMSSIAAEGMYGSLEPNGFVEDDPEYFVEKAIELYQNETLWIGKQTQGFRIIKERFNAIKFQEPLATTIAHQLKNLEAHRRKNFIGQMLQHHRMQSSKFMSKWIEQKNYQNPR